eukprot:530559-Hanusia_phi.AAC.3
MRVKWLRCSNSSRPVLSLLATASDAVNPAGGSAPPAARAHSTHRCPSGADGSASRAAGGSAAGSSACFPLLFSLRLLHWPCSLYLLPVLVLVGA